ncbi:hypothetical protein [Brooklawnia cerclae]|uniref:Muramoyltetrapeptide carboxypeptidase LdcA involved in peptidoglycan recycling n=1 Tax=Brooklawnia cerclae TaxID=349934 RepID=A0ABX0SP02_9ACTN|nr:hypothetical protein [Brooklawnia cerclae]NIH58491.1 muramoyltetrapeptide carboxypeptidase LdcA involved in peptidoglycan recycling [Brooklawnia cerclae]
MPLPSRSAPEIVCVCGSTRFHTEQDEVNRILTLHGAIVLGCGVFGHDGDPITDADKQRLDDLHKRKIDMADRVVVVAPGGYIGESTKSEIAYAGEHYTPVEIWDWEPEAAGQVPLIGMDAG